jgi:hypothetical protein
MDSKLSKNRSLPSTSVIRELDSDEIDMVIGGIFDVGLHPGCSDAKKLPIWYGTSNSPLLGVGSYKDTIDNNDNLPS